MRIDSFPHSMTLAIATYLSAVTTQPLRKPSCLLPSHIISIADGLPASARGPEALETTKPPPEQ